MEKRCVILGAGPTGQELSELRPDDFLICADGGLSAALRLGIRPQAVLGDFDSLPKEERLAAKRLAEEGVYLEKHPREKDETDLLLCLAYGKKQGFRRFLILGGLGGRMDHTWANVQLLAWGCGQGLSIVLKNAACELRMMGPGTLRLPRREGAFVSILSYSEVCRGVTLKGLKYPLENAELRSDFPLGISNEFAGSEAEISCREGMLLVLLVLE